MALRRVTDKQVDEKKAKLGQLETRIERWKVLKDGRNSPFWKQLGPAIKYAKEAHEKDALRLLCEDKDGLAKVAAGQAKAYDSILTDVEDAEKKIERAEEDIAAIKNDIRRAKERGGIVND